MDAFFPFARHDRGREPESVSEGRAGQSNNRSESVPSNIYGTKERTEPET